jgi:ABC-type transport system substrate-binding protein
MKSIVLLGALTAMLLVSAACTSTAPANANSTTTTTTVTNTSNTANRATTPPASNTSNTSNSNSTSNTSSTSDSSTASEGKQDFTLVNKTGVEIDKVFISPHDADSWQEDILGRDTLPDGQSVDIKFHRNEKAAMWDLRIEDSKGNAIEWENLNLLEISKITLHYENGKATAETE